MQNLLIDFDSTFIQTEGMEELAEIALEKNPQKESILKQIAELTEKGMRGEIGFQESLLKRIKLLEANTSHIAELNKKLKEKITPSIARNKKFFQQNSASIFIISGGFKEFILPIVSSFGIAEDHVFANTFLYDENGQIIGADMQNPLTTDLGKALVVKSLNLSGDIYILGDGYTDFQLKKHGLVKKFIAFTENVQRETVIKEADHIVTSFEEVISYLPLTQL